MPRDGGGILTLRLFDSLKPWIAACNGPAVGVGATMQLAMDVRVASTSARYGFVFALRGAVPEAASSWFLPRIVGLPTALEWTLAGRMVSAMDAREAGLVRSVHEPADLLPVAMKLAREIADNAAPVSVAATRQMLWRLAGAPHPMAAHRADSRGMLERSQATDMMEGVASFMEKRAPQFRDRVSTQMPGMWPDWSPPEF